MPFELAYQYTSTHLIPQHADLILNPPESYFFIQDGLIISCGVLYALCYMFYMTRTWRDRYLSGSVLFLAGTMAYELFYALRIPSTLFEQATFLIWFLFDLTFAIVALYSAYTPSQRGPVTVKLTLGVVAGVAFLHALAKWFPDEREQLTAYWTSIILQLPISCGHLWLLVKEKHTKGQSLEMWITRYLGCYTAYGLFIWRYVNVPQNWEYVNSAPSWWIIGTTMAAETVYPFVYVWVYGLESEKGKGEVE